MIDFDEFTGGFLDTQSFKTYTARVLAAIAWHKTPCTIGDIKRRMGNTFIPEWTQDALRTLRSDKLIIQTCFVSPSRYTTRPQAAEKPRVGYGRTPAIWKRKKPDAEYRKAA